MYWFKQILQKYWVVTCYEYKKDLSTVRSKYVKLMEQDILCSYLYSEYILHGSLAPGTLLSRIINNGYSPSICALKKVKITPTNLLCNNGIVDSLRMVLNSKTFNKAHSEDHYLAGLLCKAF